MGNFIKQFKFEIIVIVCWDIASFIIIGDVNLLYSNFLLYLNLCCLLFLLIADIESGKFGLVLQGLLWILGIVLTIYAIISD